MKEYNFLLIDDDLEQHNLFDEAIREINEEDKANNLSYLAVKTPEDAIIALYKYHFYAIFIDLKLSGNDNMKKDDEELSGNILLKQIIEKEIIPIIIRTGFPEKISDDINKSMVRICRKDETLYDVIKEVVNMYSDSVFRIFGSRGEISLYVKELFWNVIPECFSESKVNINFEKKETVMIRYISTWLVNKYMFDEKYIDAEPIEMYLFPNPIEQVCTCDIYEKKKNDDESDYYIVLTPSCDLANKKIDEVILCKIKKYDEVKAFKETLDNYINEDNKEKGKAKKVKETLSKWFRNSSPESIRYHFLPRFSKFEGGFVDFRSIISLEYDKVTGEIKDSSYSKIGVITESFKREIVSRFGSYYHRQGQPEFNSDSVLVNLQ